MSASHQLLQEAKRTDPSLVIFELVHSFTLLQLLQSQGKEQTTDDKIWTTIGRALANAAAAASPAKTADIDAAAAAAEAHVHNRKALHASGNGWITVTRTEEEVSVLVEDGIAHDLVEAGKQGGAGSRWEVEDGWACLRVRGPMALSESLSRLFPSLSRLFCPSCFVAIVLRPSVLCFPLGFRLVLGPFPSSRSLVSLGSHLGP